MMQGRARKVRRGATMCFGFSGVVWRVVIFWGSFMPWAAEGGQDEVVMHLGYQYKYRYRCKNKVGIYLGAGTKGLAWQLYSFTFMYIRNPLHCPSCQYKMTSFFFYLCLAHFHLQGAAKGPCPTRSRYVPFSVVDGCAAPRRAWG